jgi:hypothetical protein
VYFFSLARPLSLTWEYADIGDTVYYTTGTKRGKCYMIVTETAKESFVGRTASLVNTGTGPGHFQRVMSSIGTTLLVLCVCEISQSVAAKFKSRWGFKGNYLVIGRLDWWLLPWCQSRDPEGQQPTCLHIDFPGTCYISIVPAERSLIGGHM